MELVERERTDKGTQLHVRTKGGKKKKKIGKKYTHEIGVGRQYVCCMWKGVLSERVDDDVVPKGDYRMYTRARNKGPLYYLLFLPGSDQTL